MRAALVVVPSLVGASIALAPPGRADICAYPGVGIGVNVLVGHGGFCDYPTEINGSHMHCETGGYGGGGAFGTGFGGSDAGISGAFGSSGIGGGSCSWRCPDNTLAPAPNPPGAWKEYLVPMNSTNWCFIDGHMDPNGSWSAPVLPTEGIPPVNIEAPQPGEMPPPQPVPKPLPTPEPDVPLITPTPAPPEPELAP